MTTSPFDLSNKTAMVTGCNTGLGQAIAIGLAQAGCDVVGVNRSEPTQTAEQITQLGRRFIDVRADLSGGNDVIAQLLQESLSQVRTIDILVNNAGIIRRDNAIDFTEQDWDDVIDVNLKSAFFLSQALAKHFIAENIAGKIIHIASMLSFQGGIRVPSYTASKSGLAGLTKAMANEWAAHNINVNAIAPGYMATNNTEALRQDEQRNAEILNRIPAGRWGSPADVAGPCVFLASSAADYVNGTTLAVDGGWLAR
ncbi:2-dehydro-3-deoxy-D-gluconate 5-dehydrogenase KduD [Reinekea thalattae]|uniref:2-dehydro-3-deoxy-D-gluconate 5-dehydrogenase n=1 Tax=Reinekea thalattae TaxID=2593301 RepID=A0A5C8ZBV5_9GAMM|nr:2-dehydro-3-deoxy-D-gluconate 5-dehydrogenase KduD [Reinekea thalattae]TXR54386.1 2-dehydro-3-deoxy-D-gluconate 5-dehydrogenase KduD [Reinekea thalattae]